MTRGAGDPARRCFVLCDSRPDLWQTLGRRVGALPNAQRRCPRRSSPAVRASSVTPRARSRNGSRRRPARCDPAPARPRESRHHLHIPARHRQRGDHRDRPHSASSCHPRHGWTPRGPLALRMGSTSRPGPACRGRSARTDDVPVTTRATGLNLLPGFDPFATAHARSGVLRDEPRFSVRLGHSSGVLLVPNLKLLAPDVEPRLVGLRRRDGAVGESAVFARLSATERADDELGCRAAVCGWYEHRHGVSAYVGSTVSLHPPLNSDHAWRHARRSCRGRKAEVFPSRSASTMEESRSPRFRGFLDLVVPVTTFPVAWSGQILPGLPGARERSVPASPPCHIATQRSACRPQPIG